jgi:hypothetical protein
MALSASLLGGVTIQEMFADRSYALRHASFAALRTQAQGEEGRLWQKEKSSSRARAKRAVEGRAAQIQHRSLFI